LNSHRVLRHRVHLLGGAVLVVLALLLAAPAAQAQLELETDLSIDKSDDPDPVAVGEELTYTLLAENHGPFISTGATIVDQLPGTRPTGSDPQVMFQDASAGCTYNGMTHDVTCETSLLELLLPGQTKTFRIDVIPLPTVAGEFIIDIATIEEDPALGGDEKPSNDTDEEDTQVEAADDVNGEPPPESEAECDGEPATVVGTSGDDAHVHGTEGDDVIAGLGGDDTVHGHGGNDRVCGHAGEDTVDGGPGFDFVLGGLDNDLLLGAADSDLVRGGGGNDNASGNTGRDAIGGGSGDDDLFGNEEDDFLFGAGGDDSADGGSGTRDWCNAETEVRCERG
jgi:uncharacterized repeat protein (TIGR01451 family)